MRTFWHSLYELKHLRALDVGLGVEKVSRRRKTHLVKAVVVGLVLGGHQKIVHPHLVRAQSQPEIIQFLYYMPSFFFIIF